MVTRLQAMVTYEMTRAFYEGQRKSSNKAYFATGSWSPDGVATEKGANLTPDQKSRNEQTLRNIKAHQDRSNEKSSNTGKTPYDIGEALYKQNNTLGNCGEMAAVAIYLSIAHVGVAADQVSMWQLTGSTTSYLIFTQRFAHSLAALGTGPLADRWVVDPWAGVWCTADKYKEKMSAQMSKWLTDGKRVEAGGNWVEPTNELVTSILSTAAKFHEYKAHQAGS